MMHCEVTTSDQRGWHLDFGLEVNEDNFLEACSAAIEMAKTHCASEEACAMNFVAAGVGMQVVEFSEAQIQFALWKRCLEHRMPKH